jgi:hypothetical protein
MALMRRFWVAWASASAFIALAIAVDLGLLDTLDLSARAWARPGEVWGAVQMRADFVVEGLRPIVVAGLLAGFTGACCVKRRSLRPAAFVSGVCLATAASGTPTVRRSSSLTPVGAVRNDSKAR